MKKHKKHNDKDVLLDFDYLFEPHFCHNRFYEYWQHKNYISKNCRLSISESWEIEPKRIEACVEKLSFLLQKSGIDVKHIGLIKIILRESFNNASTHSQSEVPIFFAFNYAPKLNTLHFFVCDLGIGIPNSIRKYKATKNEVILSDEIALQYAIKRGNGAKSTLRNHGWGLDNIREEIEKMKGKGRLEIFSNYAYYSLCSEEKCIGTTNPFNGTFINIKLQL